MCQKYIYMQAETTTQFVECLPNMHKALGSTLRATQSKRDDGACLNLSTQEVEAEELEAHGYPQLHSKLEVSLCYMKHA